jgi:pimeloyl-ACP methyl ester carboxylesterase
MVGASGIRLGGLQTTTSAISIAGDTRTPAAFLQQFRRYEEAAFFAYSPREVTADQPIWLAAPGTGRYEYVAELIPLAWGTYAVGMIPVNAAVPPILAFPGTNPGVETGLKGATILADVDPLGPGYTIARESAKNVGTWLEQAQKKSGRRAVCVGHSLGGALAVQAAVRNPGLVDQVVTFNAPMVARSIGQLWRDTPENERAPITHLFRKGDLVAKLGSEAIGDSYEIDRDGSHNSSLVDDSSVRGIEKVERSTTPLYRVVLQFLILSLAFLLVGAVALLLRILCITRGERLPQEVKIFDPAGIETATSEPLFVNAV